MKKHQDVVFTLSAVAVLGLALLPGCNQSQSLFQNTSNLQSPAPGTGAGAAQNAPVQPNAPYVLSAKSTGNFIEFSIYNMSDSDLVIEREDFAVISPENRAITPYTREAAVIDLPQPAVVKPNSTVHGRAIFKSVTNPVGQRLVFKPDNVGTFADINRQ